MSLQFKRPFKCIQTYTMYLFVSCTLRNYAPKKIKPCIRYSNTIAFLNKYEKIYQINFSTTFGDPMVTTLANPKDI